MRRIALLLFLPCFLACGQGLPRDRFVPPDGHWWLAASDAARDGYFVGWYSCYDRHPGADFPLGIANVQIEGKVSDYYRDHPADAGLAAAIVIVRLFNVWRKTGAYRFERVDPKDEWDGDYWRQAVEGERPALVLGFESCQSAAGIGTSGAPVTALVDWINRYYAISPSDPGVVGPRANDKLGTAILAAEEANP